MKKRSYLMLLALVLSLTLAIGSTLAYLTDTDGDVNVMTVGNVEIAQLEKERIEQSDDNTAPENIRNFQQNKPLYPYVGQLGWADGWQEWPTGGSSALFTDDVQNVLDKFVFVENTGKSDAYVRTWFAFEQGSLTDEQFDTLIGINYNGTHWAWETVATRVEIDGNTYTVMCATYLGNAGANGDEHVNGVLAADEVTRPSLLQVYLDKTASNDDVEAVDGNGNGTYDILVVSQAIQTAGFENAAAALDAGFGATDEADSMPFDAMPWPGFIMSAQEAFDTSKVTGEYTLGVDFSTTEAEGHYNANREYAVRDNTEYTINLNGHTITHDGTYQDGNNTGYTYLYTVAYGGKLTINGDGTIKSANADGNCCIVYAQGDSEVVINGGDFYTTSGIPVWAGNGSKVTINGGSFISDGSDDMELIYSSGGVIDIYGGFFHNTEWEERPVNVADRNRGTGFINIYGGTFVNFDPSTGGNDPGNIRVMDGYKVVPETQDNGDVWYTVVKK